MQAKSFVANSVLTAPCGCEGFDIMSTAAFSIQYIDFTDQIPVGDAFDAYDAGGGSDHWATIWAPPGYAFKPGQKIALISSATQPTIVVPRRAGTR